MAATSDWISLARRLAESPDDGAALAALRALAGSPSPPAWPQAAPPPEPADLHGDPAPEPPARWHARRLLALTTAADAAQRAYHARWLWHLLDAENPDALPRVSVVIGTYQRAARVCEAVESALAQDYPAKEVVVVDDASSDDTAARLAAFGGRISVIRRAVNGGAAAARNDGVRAARGELVQFLDSDDLLRPGALSLKVAALAARPQAGLCFSELEFHDLESGLPRERRTRIPPGSPTCASRAPLHALIGRFFRFPSCVMVPRWRILAVGGFDARLRLHDDRLFYGHLGIAGVACIAIDRPLTRIRTHPGSLSHSGDPRLDGPLAGLLLLNELLPRPDLWWLLRDVLAMLHWNGTWPPTQALPPEDDRRREFERFLAGLTAIAEGRLASGRSPRPLAADMAAGLAAIRAQEPWEGPLSERLDVAIARCAAAGPPPGPDDLADWRGALDPAASGAAFQTLFAALGADLRRGRPWVPLATLDGRPFRSLAHPARRRWRLLAKVARRLGEGPARRLARLLG